METHLQPAQLSKIWEESLSSVTDKASKNVRIGSLTRKVKQLIEDKAKPKSSESKTTTLEPKSKMTNLQAIQELAHSLKKIKGEDPKLAPLAQKLVHWEHFGTLDFKTRVTLKCVSRRLEGKSELKPAFQIKEFFRTIVRFAAKHSQASPEFRTLLLEREHMIAQAISTEPFDKKILETALEPIDPTKEGRLYKGKHLSSVEKEINSWLESVKKDPTIIAKLAEKIEETPTAELPKGLETSSKTESPKKSAIPDPKELDALAEIKGQKKYNEALSKIADPDIKAVEAFFETHKKTQSPGSSGTKPSANSHSIKLLALIIQKTNAAEADWRKNYTGDKNDKDTTEFKAYLKEFKEKKEALFGVRVAGLFQEKFHISEELTKREGHYKHLQVDAKRNDRSWQKDFWDMLTSDKIKPPSS